MSGAEALWYSGSNSRVEERTLALREGCVIQLAA